MAQLLATLRNGLLAALLVTGAAAADEQSVTMEDGRLSGTLARPHPATTGPAVLIIAGSGPTDRDGNSAIPGVKPATYKLLAEGLAKAGIPSLRFDKRGVGASKAAMAAEADLRFSTYVDDAVAWTQFLKSQSRVSCVVLFGHSEGALIAALAAARTEVCGVISASGMGVPADETILQQFTAGGAPAPVLEQARTYLAKLKAGETLGEVPASWAAMFRPSIQPYLISWIAVDPVAALGAVKAPVLILQGTTDIQVSAEDAKRLAAGAPKARLVLLEGANHVLKSAPAERRANLATYADPALPLAPEVLPAVVSFVKGLP